jgi:hypothetical protein
MVEGYLPSVVLVEGDVGRIRSLIHLDFDRLA